MALQTASTPIAKSLHTLTVLQQVARVIQNYCAINDPEEALELAMREALTILGLARRPDPYGLAARALALLTN